MRAISIILVTAKVKIIDKRSNIIRYVGRFSVEQEETKIVLSQTAAQMGDPEAMIRLAGLYEHGRGVDYDLEESRLWFTTAAKRGNLIAICKLGELQVGQSFIVW